MIPKTFDIFGERHKVSFVKKVDNKDSVGEWDPAKNRIRIKRDLPQDQKEQTYFHELLHCILFHLSYNELNDDEEFIDRTSKAMHQAIKTSCY